MEGFLIAAFVVTVAELGDKSQLLSLVLATRYRRKMPIIAGIFAASLINHAIAGVVGVWLTTIMSPETVRWSIAFSFFIFGAWALFPESLERAPQLRGRGVFVTTLLTFFLIEMGDKTQLATVALSARFQPLGAVIAGSTLGMLVANVPTVWIGARLAERLNLQVIRWVTAAVFFTVGVVVLVSGGS